MVISTLMPTFFGLSVFTVYDASFDTRLKISEIYSLVTLFNSSMFPIQYLFMGLMNRADAR